MHQSSSSSKSHIQKSSIACPTHMKMQKQRVRNPFQDLNNAAAADSTSNASSLSSIEAPKGCLRFFLSHTCSNKTRCSGSSSSNSNHGHGFRRTKLISTPKSAPNLRPAKENSSKRFNFHKQQKLERRKKNPPGSRNVKVSSVLNSNGSSVNKSRSVSREVEQVVAGRASDFGGSNLTPANKVSSSNVVVSEKLETGCSSNTKSTNSNSKTPPVQVSVSPEIQCGSSMVTTAAKTITPVCYEAGFVRSGVTDKRKCRPRGILTIGEAKPLSCFDSENEFEQELGLVSDSAVSALPLPSEASMHWLLSPCNEENEEKKEDSEIELFGFPKLEDKSGVLCSEEEKKNCSDSPASLSSGNVIQTPQSDCSSDSNRKNHEFDHKHNSISERIENASLSPNNYVSIWDPAGSSFQFDCLSSPSKSVDLSHFKKVLDDRTSWLSDSTMENVSRSQMRTSWREGLVSRMFEMDEFDCCRCLSDVEDDSNVLESHCSPKLNVNVVNERVSSYDSSYKTDVKSGHGNDRKAEEKTTHRVPCECAESVSTEAGSLVRSDDSDWTICYKNNLFQ